MADAKIGWTHAITIGARPAAIWPWLVQMGCRRAGWYSYDGLDNAAVPSADRILPEFQQVQVGDILPQTPTAEDRFVVRVVEPQRALVLGDDAGSMSWAFVLEPVGATGTRLITRSRGASDRVALGLLLKVVWHPVHFGMQRRQLLNLKRPWWRRRPDGAPARKLDEAESFKASGVTKGGFYFHLPSKEVLALATLRRKQEQGTGVVMAAVLRRRVPSTSSTPWSRHRDRRGSLQRRRGWQRSPPRHTKASLMARSGPPGGRAEPA